MSGRGGSCGSDDRGLATGGTERRSGLCEPAGRAAGPEPPLLFAFLSGRLSLFFNLLIRLLELSLQIALGRHLAKRFPLPYFPRTTWEEVSMDIEGEERVRASRDVVWRALNDPEVLKQCIPGCQSLEQASPTELQVVVRIKIGPVTATFNG